MTVTPHIKPEFSRCLVLDRLAGGTVVEELAASEAEREALAERFRLGGLNSLSARVSARRPGNGPLVRVEGHFVAEVVQTCVITLEAVHNRVDESFVQLFTLEAGGADREVVVSAEDEDAPEPLTGDTLDLGEAVAEQLSLALDPYPRAPGATFEGATFGRAGDAEEEEVANPFAVLRELKRGS